MSKERQRRLDRLGAPSTDEAISEARRQAVSRWFDDQPQLAAALAQVAGMLARPSRPAGAQHGLRESIVMVREALKADALPFRVNGLTLEALDALEARIDKEMIAPLPR